MKNTAKEISAILFDLGNVIIKLKMDAIEEGYAEYSEKVTEGKFIDYVLDSDNINDYMEGKINSSQFYKKTCRFFGMRLNYHEFYRIWNSMFGSYPEIEKAIKTLKDKYPEIKLVLISNTNEAHYEYIKEEYGILKLLDDHVVSHEVGKQKPDPEIFVEAMKKAGSIPKTTFYTDDRPDLIEAARVMGIRAFQFTGYEELKKQLAKYDIHV